MYITSEEQKTNYDYYFQDALNIKTFAFVINHSTATKNTLFRSYLLYQYQNGIASGTLFISFYLSIRSTGENSMQAKSESLLYYSS